MKSVAAMTVLLAGLLTASSAQSNTTQMSDFQFFTTVTYNTYNGFVRGFYREHAHTIISEQCLGTWVGSNLTHLGNVWS